jgi:hypothetical protein
LRQRLDIIADEPGTPFAQALGALKYHHWGIGIQSVPGFHIAPGKQASKPVAAEMGTFDQIAG